MANEKQNLDPEKIDAFFKSPIGFWISITVIASIASGAIISSIVGMFT